MTAPMNLRAIILGCGSSGGVPRPGGPDGKGHWGQCDPDEPKNRRMRCSLLVQRAHADKGWEADELTTILVDTSPDLREQLLLARCGRLDAVLFTHDHADQSHGIDDLRLIALNMMARIPVWLDRGTSGALLNRFAYCFEREEGSYYPAILELNELPPCGDAFEIDGPTGPIPVRSFLQHHGQVDSLGFLFGDGKTIGYSSDVVDLPEESFALLEGCHTWIVDSLRRKEHISHAHLDKTLSWLKRIRPERGILTNMHLDMDYQTLCQELPDDIKPAYDGMALMV